VLPVRFEAREDLNGLKTAEEEVVFVADVEPVKLEALLKPVG